MTVGAEDRSPPVAPVFCLSEVEVFQDLTAQEMAELLARVSMRSVDPGTVLWSPHDRQTVLFIVRSGSVRVYRLSAEGRRLTLAVLRAGALFGEMELIGQRMGEGYAEAIEPSVLCLMSEQDVRNVLLADTRVAIRIISGLGRRLAEIEKRLADTVLKSTQQRLAALLCELVPAASPETRLFDDSAAEIRLTHEQLADLLGTTRETTTKLLGELRSAGLVRLRRGGILVLDRDRLRATAELST